MSTDPNENYSKEYSEQSFWEKVKKYSKKIGLQGIYAALLLYYTLQDSNVPLKAKAIIVGALGYLVFPFDLAMDPIFVDDIGVLIGALIQVALCVTPDIKMKARAQLLNLFGEIDNNELKDIDDKINQPNDDERR